MTPAQIESRLGLWNGLAGGRAKLINLSENHTFRIDTLDGEHHILRVHRPGYHTRPAIESELAWLDALRTQTHLPTLTPIAGKDGALVQKFTPHTGENAIFVVRFAFEEGSEPQETGDLLELFGDLGCFAAICHKHAENWKLPPKFNRPAWDAGTILNAEGIWGDWRQAPNVQGGTRDILIRLDECLRTDLAAYGQEKHRFGLIHADMRLANLLVLALFGIVLSGVALAGLLSIPSVNALFMERASLSQSYDTGENGRFGRQGYAFDLALQHPWGLGPLEFRNLRIIEEPHDTYVNAIHAYGWGGGLIYWVLVGMTLWRCVLTLGTPSPNRLIMIPLVATYVPLVLESAIIDTDHWRHYFLLVGLIWGVSAGYKRLSPAQARGEKVLV